MLKERQPVGGEIRPGKRKEKLLHGGAFGLENTKGLCRENVPERGSFKKENERNYAKQLREIGGGSDTAKKRPKTNNGGFVLRGNNCGSTEKTAGRKENGLESILRNRPGQRCISLGDMTKMTLQKCGIVKIEEDAHAWSDRVGYSIPTE